jgi:hypothetical protein
MGYRELHRMEIEEVVRRWQVNESQRAIARATGFGGSATGSTMAAISWQRMAKMSFSSNDTGAHAATWYAG